jgi:hypothetical protein
LTPAGEISNKQAMMAFFRALPTVATNDIFLMHGISTPVELRMTLAGTRFYGHFRGTL